MNAREGSGVALARPQTVGELVREYGGVVDDGLDAYTVDRLVSPEHAAEVRDLVVVTSARRTDDAANARGVLLCQRDLAPRCPKGRRWVHDHAAWVVARLLEEAAGPRAAPFVHATAFVDEGADVDATATVHRGAVVHAGARIGAHSVVGEGAVVYGRTRIAERVTIGPLAVIGRPGFGRAASPDGAVLRVPQLGGVVVESDVEVGALATIDAGTLSPTILRRGVKLDAHVHVAHNVEIGEHTIVAAQAGFAGSARIGAGVLVGGQAGVTDHAAVGAGARIAAKSGVIGDVAPGSIVAGFPRHTADGMASSVGEAPRAEKAHEDVNSKRRIQIDIAKILEILPHRYPFVMVDRVTDLVAGESISGHKMVSYNEPWSQGHFPGRPIMPGVLIIESLAQIGGILAYASEPFDATQSLMYFLGIDKAKFRKTVTPGDRLDLFVEVVHHRSNVWKMRGEATVDGALCAQGELLASIVDREG